MKTNNSPHIAIVGLGYVGLPLAINLARHFTVTGFDIDTKRVGALKQGNDLTREVDSSQLKHTTLHFTDNPSILKAANIYIIAVPTPITDDKIPNLVPLEKATRLVSHYLSKNDIVVFESTVYPGVTENICGPILEKNSHLKSGKHFFLGYSPERINPGDKIHTVNKITKVVSAQTETVAKLLATIYGKINNNNIFIAKDIKTAETAKVIENTQRDINIAFINEITIIVHKMGLSIYDVLEAAKTKWNFVDFKPGLVGGHCIGIDPYYMAYCAKIFGHEPESILAGRKINENMSTFIANEIKTLITKKFTKKPVRLLMLGLTFKENVPDIRNTKITDLISTLQNAGFFIDVHDPLANSTEARYFYDISLLQNLDDLEPYDVVIGAISHKSYLTFSVSIFERLLTDDALVIDLKNMWRDVSKNLPKKLTYWSL